MNPSYQPTTGSNQATAPKSPQNIEHFQAPKTHNPFDLSHMFLTTEDYGCYNPVYGIQVTADDHIPVRVSPMVRSDSFETPLLTPLKKVFDTFYVPEFAILPNTWDYIYATPTQGDDVPDDAMCVIPNFRYTLMSLVNYLSLKARAFVSSHNTFSIDDARVFLRYIVRYWLFCEQFFSSGCLLNRFGYKLHPLLSLSDTTISYDEAFPSFDFAFDYAFRSLLPHLCISISTNSLEGESQLRTYYLANSSPAFSSSGPIYAVTAHELLSLLREYACDSSADIFPKSSNLLTSSIAAAVSNFIFSFNTASSASEYQEQFNFGVIAAYNLACAQYYVNPSVDFLYNAELYRNTMYGLLKDAGVITLNNLDFERNGHTIKYDIFSGHFIGGAFSSFRSAIIDIQDIDAQTNSRLLQFYVIFSNLFSIQNGLRYGDYFTSSKPRPLAVGSTSIGTGPSGTTIDSVDVARSLMMTRYLLACNKLSPDYEEQFKGMTGLDVPPDFHFPHFVSHSEIDLQTYEVSNTTSDDQGHQVTRIDASGSSEPVVLDIDQHGYVICISMTYMPRTYGRTKFRHFFQGNRYDMFQEMLQDIGDQPVYMLERDDNFNAEDVFGYQGRNDEYKQLFNHASGAFMDILKSWAFVADGSDSFGYKLDSDRTISPDYIRCYPAEFDRFLPVDSYLSLGHHYHFIIAYNIESISNRPMITSPSIL